MSRPYLSAFSFRSHRLIATASERSGATNEISSLKPFCFRSRGRTSFSNVRVNSPAVLAFRCRDTLRAYISTPLRDLHDSYSVSVRVTTSLSYLVHPAHAAAAGHRGHLAVLLLLHHHALGGEQQSRDGRGVLQRRARDFGRVDDAGRDQILVLVGLSVVAEVELGRFLHLPYDDRALGPRVLHDDPDRLLERAADDLDARLLVLIGAPDFLEGLPAPQQRDAAARHNALLDRGTGRVQRVLDPGLLLLHFGLGGCAHIDHRNAARQLREPLLQLLLVVIRCGLLDRRADLADAALDVGLLALATDQGRVLLIHHDTLDVAEIVEPGVLELEAQLLGGHFAPSDGRHVREQVLAPVAEAGGLDRAHLQRATQLVDHQRRERLPFDVLGDDQQRLARLRHLLEHREQVLHGGDLLLVHQDIRVLYRDHAVLAHLLHRVRDDLADLAIVVR